MKRSHSLVLSLLIAIAGCAANPGGNAGDGQPRRQPNLITAEEVQQAPPSQSALDFIRARRPNWLQGRGVQSFGSPVGGGTPTPGPAERRATGAMTHPVIVYLDGTRAGGPEILQQFLASQVQEARYLSATEASARFGADHPGGAILITTRRR